MGASVFTSFGAFFVGRRLFQFLEESVQSSASFEQAFAQARRTIAGTEEEMAALNTQIRALSREIPVPAAELAQIAQSAGQLGIASTGVADFVRVVALLGSTSELSTEQAETFIGRFSNIANVLPSQFENLASSILKVGTNSASTEPEIAAFSLRIAAAAQNAGIAAPAILGIGAAFASAGVPAERGGTAINRILTAITQAVAENSPKLREFAAAAGLTADEFTNLFRTNAAEAFIRFMEGISASGDRATIILRELGLTDARLVQAVTSVANAQLTLRQAIDISSEGWVANNELSKQAETIYGTNAAQLEILGQQFDEVRRRIGGTLIPVINELGGAFTSLPVAVQTGVVAITALTAGLAVVVIIAARVKTALDALNISAALSAGRLSLLARAGQVGLFIALAAAVQKAADQLQRMSASTNQDRINTLIHTLRTATPGTLAFADALGNVNNALKSSGTRGGLDRQLEALQRAGGASPQQAADFVRNLGLTTDQVAKQLPKYSEALKDSSITTGILGDVSKQTSDELARLGINAGDTSGEVAAISLAAQAATQALSLLNQVSTQFDQRLASLTPRIGETFRESVSGGPRAASDARARRDALEGLARAEEDGARRIADARRRLQRETEQASRREIEARRDVANAEEDAAQRTIDALQRVQDQRFQASRSFADAQQALLDIQEDLARTGGAQTPEDQRRLRDAQQAVERSLEDARRTEEEGNRDLARIAEDNAERIADARRKESEAAAESARQIADARRALADAEREAAERIADAQQRVADAADKAANRVQSAAEKTKVTLASLSASFRTNATDINLFVDSLGTIQSKLKALAPDVAQPFLAQLLELGPGFASQIARLAESPKALQQLAKGFGAQIQAAKRAADLEFDKFPQNFRIKTNAATRASLRELETFVGQFNVSADKITFAETIKDQITTGVEQFHILANQAGIALSQTQLDLINKIEDPAADAIGRVRNLQALIADLKGKITLDSTQFHSTLAKARKALEEAGFTKAEAARGARFEGLIGEPRNTAATANKIAEVTAQTVQMQAGTVNLTTGNVLRRQHGGEIPFSGAFWTGETGAELAFLPRGTNVFTHLQSEQFLNQLRALGSGGGARTINQTVIAQEVAGDAEATARSIAFRLGQDAIR